MKHMVGSGLALCLDTSATYRHVYRFLLKSTTLHICLFACLILALRHAIIDQFKPKVVSISESLHGLPKLQPVCPRYVEQESPS